MMRCLPALLLLFTMTSVAFAELRYQVYLDHQDGVYAIGETVDWKIQVVNTSNEPVPAGEVKYRILSGGLKEIAAGTVPLENGVAHVKGQRAEPGSLLLKTTCTLEGIEKPLIDDGGAVFAPDQIQASSPPPEDFDAFWKAKVAELHSIPMNAQLEKVDIGNPEIEYYKITFDNIHGRKIQGQLAKPVGKTDLPAMLQVQAAGVYALQRPWVVEPAKKGWLALNISAHDLPIDEPAEFYKEQAANQLKDYRNRDSDDREKSYFLPMFLSCYRAVDYLTEQPEWNKKTVFVHGSSQGGYQSLVTAGLHPKVTGIAGNLPAGCDHTGELAGRAPGWPQWANPAHGKDVQKELETARYFDAMNFATRITCPAMITVGLIDTTCPAEGVIATVNQIKPPHELMILPQASHGKNYQAYFPALTKKMEEHRVK